MATVIGSKSVSVVSSYPETSKSLPIPINVDIISDPLASGLPPQAIQSITSKLDQADILSMPLRDISSLCGDVESNLSKSLDKFLEKIDEMGGSKVTDITKALYKSVEKENLEEIATNILEGKSGFLEGVKQKFLTTFKGLSKSEGREQFLEEARNTLKGKSVSLLGVMNNLEGELKKELTILEGSVNLIEDVKDEYRESFLEYLNSVIFLRAFLSKARMVTQEEIGKLDPDNPIHQSYIREMGDKIECLESRSMALEGTLVSLPADDLVISQLHRASITTRQELITNIPAKFNRIKMTLIKLNNALILKGVQSINENSNKLDKALHGINAKLTNDVVTVAANLAGDNRKSQAEHVMSIINETKELMDIAESGRVNNMKKFSESRVLLENARNILKTK